MTPPKPPPRPGSPSVRLPPIREEVAPGAVQDPSLGRPPAPRRERAQTAPGGFAALQQPRAGARAREDAEAPAEPVSEPQAAPAGVHPLSERPGPPTNPPPADPDDGDRPSRVELQRQLRKVEWERDQAQAAQLEGQRFARQPTEPRRAHPVWKALGAILAGLVVTLASYFGLVSKTQLEPKVDATRAVQAVTVEDLKALRDDVAMLRAWKTAEVAHRDCLERQTRDAIERIGGHTLTTAPRGGTDWAQQSAPPSTQRVPWVRSPWFTTEACPAAPP